MTGDPGVTLESLDFEWGDAYLICYARDQWAALRRDTRRFLTAQTLDELAARIDADYAAHPVPRGCDPPGTADYLNAPDEDEAAGQDGERLELLAGLRDASPRWAISYSPFSRTWTAREDDATIARTRPRFCTSRHADRAETTPGPARPGWDWPPWPGTSPS